jgi:ubiquinone/menaquinone biosynthesis C-methylase UbiE
MAVANHRATAAAKARYGRLAPFYDLLGILPEMSYRRWREDFWRRVLLEASPGSDLLEIGVGTGKNIPYWPKAVTVTAIDLTPGMVRRARERARELGSPARVLEGDVQALEFPDDSFDMAAATFVFCSVPDPVLGLNELARVVRPGGSIYLMEHLRSEQPIPGKIMDLLNPIVVRLMGSNINRDTAGNVTRSGLELEHVENIGGGGILKILHARAASIGKGKGEHA